MCKLTMDEIKAVLSLTLSLISKVPIRLIIYRAFVLLSRVAETGHSQKLLRKGQTDPCSPLPVESQLKFRLRYML